MREFDPTQPLIFIHVPKTAGTSVRTIFEQWFPDRLYRHYFNRPANALPRKLDLSSDEFAGTPPVIYGHFNRHRGFGIEAYYPEVRQFICILRDPLDLHVSTYFFILRTPQHPQHDELARMSLDKFIQTRRPNMLEHFPRQMSMENYRDVIEEFFVDIGCFETLRASMIRIGGKLSKPTDNLSIPQLNTTPRDESDWPDHRAAFRARWPLEHAVYDYTRAMAPQE